MRPLTARGTTLPELLQVVVLLGLLGGVGVSLVRWAVSATVRAGHLAAEERDATALLALLGHDLVPAVDSEVRVPLATALEFERPVGEAPVCGAVGGDLLVRASGWRGERLPAASRDEVLALVVADPATWLRRVVVAVAAAACPDGAAAIRLVPDHALPFALHLRVVEPVRLRRYASGGAQALGLEHRWNGGVIQPFTGPVNPAGVHWWRQAPGLRVRYHGAAGVGAALLAPLE